MEQQIEQVVRAISIAFDQTQILLHQEALAYLSTIQANANETWRLALKIFVDQNPDGSRKYPSQARFFSLRVLDDFLDNR
jgi:exportin-T